MRKWVLHGDEFVGDPVLQVVVPSRLREMVLKRAHDESGRWGVRKTYDRIFRFFSGLGLREMWQSTLKLATSVSSRGNLTK